MAESTSKGMQIQKSNDRDADLHKPYVPIKDRIIRDVSVEGFETCSLPMFGLKLALKKHFASCGNILSVCFIKSVAFIRFDGEDAQEKALQLDGTDVGGWTAIVKAAVRPMLNCFPPPARTQTQSSVLFVSGYDTGLPEIDIQIALCDLFSTCGDIWGVSVTPSGSAIITIEGEGCVEKALELSGRKVGEMNLLVHTGKRDTEIPLNRRLINENACGYALGSYSRLVAKRRKMEMAKEKKKEREMKVMMKKEKEKEKEREKEREMKVMMKKEREKEREMKVMMKKEKEKEREMKVMMKKEKEKERENENEKKKKKKDLF